jgi:hypothetical protein
MPTSAYSCVPRCVYTVNTPRPFHQGCTSGTGFSLRSVTFLPSVPGIFQTGSSSLPFPRRSYANFCLLMCAKVRIHAAFRQGCTFGTRFLLRSGIFLPSGPRIFQTGSSSLPFPVAPMPTSAYSCVPRCVYTVNTRLLSGLHIRNRIFAQIQNFFAIRTQNFPNRIQFLTFSSRSYASFCLLMCAKVRIYCKYTPSVRVPHPAPDLCSDPEFFAIWTRNFQNRIQFPPFSGRSYANFCLLMCAKVRIHCKYTPSVRAAHPNRIYAQIRNFLPSGPGIFQTGSISLPFPFAPMPTSAYSCVQRCVYTVNTHHPSGLHIRNWIFAQIRIISFVRYGSGIFQTGSSSLPFPVAPMPTSAYS